MRKCKKAGITMEVSFVLPLFLFFLFMVFSAFDMICIHAEMDSALQQVGRELSAYTYMFETYYGALEKKGTNVSDNQLISEKEDSTFMDGEIPDFLQDMFLKEGYLKSRIIALVGKERIEESLIIGGVNGITFWRSDLMEDNDILDLTLTYRVRPWFSFAGIGEMTLMNRCYVHTYTGYRPDEDGMSEKMFYITDYAEVYHTNRECTHLRLSIRHIRKEELLESRNLYGERYTECEICYEEELATDGLYIALQGDRYHSVISCSGLKRTVYMVPASEIKGLPLCSRCLKEGY